MRWTSVRGKSLGDPVLSSSPGSRPVAAPALRSAASAVTHGPGLDSTLEVPRLRVASYNLLAQSKLRGPQYAYCRASDINWHRRRAVLLAEMLAMAADVLCLQEVDYFDEWWRPQLGAAGYDAMFRKRGRRRRDGVAVFFLRDKFQLFASDFLDFNTAGTFFGEERPSSRLQQDNVGVVVALQPWEASDHPSAVIVSSVQLVATKTATPDVEAQVVQRKQVLMLLRSLERFNADFSLPVVLCGTFNLAPQNDNYFVVTRGSLPPRLRAPEALARRPIAVPLGRSQARVSWRRVPSAQAGDADIIGFAVRRRVGGNHARGFVEEQYFAGADRCDALIGSLAAGVTHEFVVAAVSPVGVGAFSQPSQPIATVPNLSHPPLSRFLKHPTEAGILPEKDGGVETLEDWLALVETETDAGANGNANDEAIINANDNNIDESNDEYKTSEASSKPIGIGKSVVRVLPKSKSKSTSRSSKLEGRTFQEGVLKKEQALAPRFEDRSLNLAVNPSRATRGGARPADLVHTLGLASAYGTYRDGFEPAFTINSERFRGCVDYIFHSSEAFEVLRLLACPEANLREDELNCARAKGLDGRGMGEEALDPRRPARVLDERGTKPVQWDDVEQCEAVDYELGVEVTEPNLTFLGSFELESKPNPNLTHSWFPSPSHPSDHIPLMCDLGFVVERLATEWK